MNNIDVLLQILLIAPIISSGLIALKANSTLGNFYSKFINIFDLLEALVSMLITSYLCWQVFCQDVSVHKLIINISSNEEILLPLGIVLNKLSGVLLQIIMMLLFLTKLYNFTAIFNSCLPARYYLCLNYLRISMMILLLSHNLLQLLMGSVLVGAACHMLLTSGGNFSKEHGFKSLIMNKFADILLLLAIAWIYKHTASLVEVGILGSWTAEVIVCILLSGFIKSICILLDSSGVKCEYNSLIVITIRIAKLIAVTAGVFIVLKYIEHCKHDQQWLNFVLALTMIGSILPSILASVTVDFGKLIQYHMLAQLSTVFMAVILQGYDLGAACLLNFTVNTTLWVLLLDKISTVTTSVDNSYPYINIVGVLMLILNLSNFPLSANFFVNNLIINALKNSNLPWSNQVYWLLGINVFLYSLYGVRWGLNAIFHANNCLKDKRWCWQRFKSADFTIVLLSVVMIGLGIFLGYYYAHSCLELAIKPIIDHSQNITINWRDIITTWLGSIFRVQNCCAYLGVGIAFWLYLKPRVTTYFVSQVKTNFLFIIKLLDREYFGPELLDYLGFTYVKTADYLEKFIEIKMLQQIFPTMYARIFSRFSMVVEKIHSSNFVYCIMISLTSMVLILLCFILKC